MVLISSLGAKVLQWRSIRRIIKLGFLTGVIANPGLTSPKYPQWFRCDNMVRCWLLNSISSGIKDGFVSCKSAKLLWTDISERYGQSNAPLLYQLKKELKNILQENSSVVEYFNKLKRHWDDIEELEEIPECTCGAMDKCTCLLYKKLLEISSREKVINFLMGLSDTYEVLRTNILSMDPVPPINKAYSIVQQVESQKMITNVLNSGQDTSAMNSYRSGAAGKQPLNVWKRDAPKKFKVNDRWCPHCNKRGHTLETCFIKNPALREKFMARFSGNVAQAPEDSVAQAPAQFAASTSQAPPIVPGYNSGFNSGYTPSAAVPVQFNPELLSSLYNHMMHMAQNQQVHNTQQDNPLDASDVSVNFAGTTTTHSFAPVHSSFDWIIDSGATDHMSGNYTLFACLKKLQTPIKIGLPDGSIQMVTHSGNIHLNNDITLHNALYVPAFKHNLLSVGKLLASTGLLIHFFVHHCIIQDPVSSCPVAV
ncbi:uncharacterized protein LOC141651276 [Silene latifolia]|uniref:uncharacterized protein LOC141651276 n=1 Tax=Silene latifolia TaxID=37657 RepID=UPI003D783327